MAYRLFVSAGEASGDRHAAALVRELRKRVGEVEVRGLGGPALRAEGAALLADVADLSLIGFSDVLKRLPFFLRLLRRAQEEIAAWDPHVVLPVDYPGFNLRLADRARKQGRRVVYYIAPQVWAWRRERRPGIARAVDQLLVVFPFEVPLFEAAGIRTVFVGHPLLDRDLSTPEADTVRERLGLSGGGKLLALIPGSRRQEVRAILPRLVAGAAPLAREGISVAVSRAPGLPDALYRPAVAAGLPLWEGDLGPLAEAADAALTASGTATLEVGLRGTPLAVVYRTGPVNWQLAKALVGLRTIGLVNIAAGGERVPELLQNDFTPERIASVARTLLFDELERAEQAAYLATLGQRLGGAGAAARAAGEVAGHLVEVARS